MFSICRFCKKREVIVIFPSTNKDGQKHASEFACTNAGFGIHGTIVKCRNCEMIYVDEDISQQMISTYYEVADDPVYFTEQPARKITFGNYLKKLEKIVPSKGKLLDIGTNTGLFVKLAKDSGWDALGLEPNKWAVDYAIKNYNIKIINKPFVAGIFPKKSFDVVTMWDVLEHFTNPVAEIEKVYTYLKPGGVFVFSTVDPESLLAKIMGTKWSWYMEMHRAFLSHDVSLNYLTKKGFSKIIFRPHFRNLSVGYLATRLEAINPFFSKFAGKAAKFFRIEKIIVPFYANDLYDCYAFK